MSIQVIPLVIMTVDPTSAETMSAGYPLGQEWFNSTSGHMFVHKSDLVWTDVSSETTTSLGALIGTAGDATPLDSDNIATALSAGGILKKLTWTAAKAFLKTYFDTLYLAATKRWILGDIATFNTNSTPVISPNFTMALYKVDASYAGNRSISWTNGVDYKFPVNDSCTMVYLKNTDTVDRVHALQTATYTYNTTVYTFTDMIGGTITVPAGKILLITYLFVHSTSGCNVEIITKIQA